MFKRKKSRVLGKKVTKNKSRDKIAGRVLKGKKNKSVDVCKAKKQP